MYNLNFRFTPEYSPSVLLSMIIDRAGRELSVKAGHAPADYEYYPRNILKLSCNQNTQGDHNTPNNVIYYTSGDVALLID